MPVLTALLSFLSAIIGGYITAWWNNRFKNNSDIQTFRYTKLYELNCELNSLEPLTFMIDENKISRTNRSAVRHEEIKNIYNKLLPILDNTNNLEKAFLKEAELSKQYLHKLSVEDEYLAKYLSLLFDYRVNCEKLLKEVTKNTLKNIIKSPWEILKGFLFRLKLGFAKNDDLQTILVVF